MKDRFDLETEIMDLWNIAEYLDLLAESVLEHDLNIDDTANAIIGIKTLLHLRTTKLLETHKECFGLDQYKCGADSI